MSVIDQVRGGAEHLRDRAAAAPSRPAVFGRRQWETLIVVAVLAALLPLVTNGLYLLGVATTATIYAVLALGFYFQFCLAGQFSLATSAFYATGAYTSVWAARHGGFLVGLVAAAVVAGLVGALLKLALARSPLIHFSIATLAFGSLALIVLRNWESFTGGATGRYGIRTELFGLSITSPEGFYLLGLAVLVIGLVLAVAFERSPARRDVIFARDMGDVARTTGLRVRRIQVAAFGIGAAYMGAAGSLLAHTSGFINTTSFSVEISLDVLLMVLLGGVGSLWGPVVGAVVLTVLPEVLRDMADYKDLIYAGIILLVVLARPGGLASLVVLARPAVVRGGAALAQVRPRRRAVGGGPMRLDGAPLDATPTREPKP